MFGSFLGQSNENTVLFFNVQLDVCGSDRRGHVCLFCHFMLIHNLRLRFHPKNMCTSHANKQTHFVYKSQCFMTNLNRNIFMCYMQRKVWVSSCGLFKLKVTHTHTFPSSHRVCWKMPFLPFSSIKVLRKCWEKKRIYKIVENTKVISMTICKNVRYTNGPTM